MILPKPITSKVVEREGDPRVAAAACSVNGCRNTMEDAHAIMVEKDRMLFGIFDGHSNDKCSHFIADHLPAKIKQQPLPIADQTIEKICLDLDDLFMKDVGDGGTTATFVLVIPEGDKYNAIFCNVGDSRMLVVRNGELIWSTADHKPPNPGERQRIEHCGGTVRMGRVDGDLAVSRAFGDAVFKRFRDDPRVQKVIAVPDITRMELQRNDILILSCDGVFEGNFSNEEVADFVLKQLPAPGEDLGVVAARVCDQAIRRGSKDNITCMVVVFGDGTDMMIKNKKMEFVPGPPYPKSHDASKTAYARMAAMADVSLATALQMRYNLLQSYVANKLPSGTPLEQTAFEMSDDIDVDNEKTFFGQGPSLDGAETFFANLADGQR